MQMKLAFIGDNGLDGVKADSRLAAENGFDGIEYNFWGDFAKLTMDTVKQMAAIHKQHKIRAAMLGTWGFNHLATNAEERTAALKVLDQQIKFAEVLKAEWIVTGCGQIHGEPDARSIPAFAETFAPICKKVQAAGLKIAFYGLHGNSFINSLEVLERAWEIVPELKLKYDPANWAYHGDDYLEIVRRYGHKIGYVHIKDSMQSNGKTLAEPPAGMGDIQFPKVMAFLYQHNYEGLPLDRAAWQYVESRRVAAKGHPSLEAIPRADARLAK